MIFCDEPYLNIPMPKELMSRQQAARLNDIALESNVWVAMVAWLNNTPELWKDVVRGHFKKNGDRILRKISEWEQKRPNLAGSLRSGRQQLQTALQQIGAVSSSTSQVSRRQQGSTGTGRSGGGYGSHISSSGGFFRG
jgi:hypothetical protein